MASGECGSCGSKDLEYGSGEPQDEFYYYYFTCNNCGKSGKEWHKLEYSETIMEK